jgi:hypothetical protein
MRCPTILAAMLIWLAAAWGSSAAASAVPQVGEELVTRMLYLDGTVLLPPGDWVVAASELQQGDGTGTDIASVVLLQPREGHVAGVILAQGNVTSLKSRPGLSAECWSEQAYFTAVAADDDSGGACAAVLAVDARQGGGNAVWDRAREFAAVKGWRLPAAFMLASLSSVDRKRLMDVRYGLAVPDALVRQDTAPCTWAVPPADGSGPIRQMAQGLTNFSEAMLPVFEMAGHSRLPMFGAAPPLAATEDTPQGLLRQLKQARIDELVENGAASPAQAEQLSRRAAEPTPGDPMIKDLLWRSGYKTLTYKAAAFIDTSAVYYFFVPDLPLVLAGSAITNVLGMPIVYINDFVWSYFGLQASKSKQPIAFASVGQTCSTR